LTVFRLRAISDNLAVIPFPYDFHPHISETILLWSFVEIAGLAEIRVSYRLLGSDVVPTMEEQRQVSG
jgi:hypothetical protein